MSDDLVSVLIPCHNAVAYVEAAVNSVLEQTYRNLEVIVVDDESSDGSWEVLRGIKSDRLKLFRHSKKNASATRNRAFVESRGTYIKFFDADDLMHQRMIEHQMDRLAGGSEAVATSEWGRFYDDNLDTFRLDPEPVWKDLKTDDWLVESWIGGQPMMQPGLFLIHRDVLERSGLWNTRLSLIDDFEFFTRVLCVAKEVKFAAGAPLCYRSGVRGSLSGRKTAEAVDSAAYALLSATSHLLRMRSDPRARLACANLFQEFIYTYYPMNRSWIGAMESRVRTLGGSLLRPAGPPKFQLLRQCIGWKAARRLQIVFQRVVGATPKP